MKVENNGIICLPLWSHYIFSSLAFLISLSNLLILQLRAAAKTIMIRMTTPVKLQIRNNLAFSASLTLAITEYERIRLIFEVGWEIYGKRPELSIRKSKVPFTLLV